MKWFLFCILILVTIVLEATWIQFPLTLLLLIFFVIFSRSEWILVLSIGAGIILDMALFRPIGVTAFFFLGLLGLIFAYEKRFEINSLPFSIGISVLAASIYTLIFAGENLLLTIIFSGLWGGISYTVLYYFAKRSESARRTAL